MWSGTVTVWLRSGVCCSEGCSVLGSLVTCYRAVGECYWLHLYSARKSLWFFVCLLIYHCVCLLRGKVVAVDCSDVIVLCLSLFHYLTVTAVL